ncbi:MAG: ribosome maturation factor RimM [Gammaproteobacteria bacterium]|nr:ribosome maturation factor RimM [Gammaproteobacteria bacterium]
MDSAHPSHLVVGHLNKPHGTKGELFLWPLTADPGEAFAAGAGLHLADEAGEKPDPAFAEVRVRGVRPFKRGFLIRLEGIDSRDQAEWLAGRYVLRPLADVPPLEDGEVFYHDLLGMRVESGEGEAVGEVVEVFELSPVHLLQVARESGTALIPFARDMVRRLDREGKRLVMDLPDGLLDL